MKPIFVIDDFSQGISYDETENTLNGFQDLSRIDLKNINGVAMLANDYRNAFSTSGFVATNHLVEYNLIPDVALTGNTQFFGMKQGSNSTIYMGNTYTKTVSQIISGAAGNGSPKYGELCIFQHRLFYPDDKASLSTASFWSTGMAPGVTSAGGTTLTITASGGQKIQDGDKSLEGGTIYLWNGSSWDTRTVTTYTAGSPATFTIDTAYPAGSYYAYIISVYPGIKRADGTTGILSTPNRTTLYRPMLEHNSKLYVGDGDLIYNLDSTLVNWSTTVAAGAISVGKNWMVKQMKELNGYIYILADQVDENYNNTFIAPNAYTASRLYIWDGTSDGFSSIVDVGTHCFCIEAIENRLYACLQTNKQDGVIFAYFNGSDFPTIAKFQLPSGFMNVGGLAYDRGRFYAGVNAGTDAYVFSYSSYAIETPVVTKAYAMTGNANYEIQALTMLQKGAEPLLVLADKGTDLLGNAVFYRRTDRYANFGDIISQKYEITENQFPQLVKGVQVNFKETMTADCSVVVKYRGDENSSWTTVGTLTSANQNSVLFGIMRRMRKIQLDLTLQTNNGTNSPKIVKINLY